MITVVHRTEYAYPFKVTENANEVRLLPADGPGQEVLNHHLAVEPPAVVRYYTDYFGNRVGYFTVVGPHDRLVIESRLTVATRRPPVVLPGEREVPFAAYRAAVLEPGLRGGLDYLLPSRYTAAPAAALEEEVEALLAEPGEPDGAAAARAAREDALAFLFHINVALRRHFAYTPAATSVETTAADVLRLRQGVCQDFSHLMIALCRHRGIPARYAGGYQYLGREAGGRAAAVELAVEHLNHAWVEAYVPGFGWQGFDPTNGCLADERYVRVAVGRDYGDVPLVKGVYRSGSAAPAGRMLVAVQVQEQWAEQ